jgi:hypothetical protein
MSDMDSTGRQDAAVDAWRVPLRYAFARFSRRGQPETADPGTADDGAAAVPSRSGICRRLVALLRDRIAD